MLPENDDFSEQMPKEASSEQVGLAESYLYRFGSVGRLYGFERLRKLAESHCAVVGLGGVGSWAAEALVRSGVGQITLMDFDDVCLSNVNRQIQAANSTVGKMKVDVLKLRFEDIYPEIKVTCIKERFETKTLGQFFGSHLDGVIDAIDSFREKALLIDECLQRGIPIVTVGGAGARRDPTQMAKSELSGSYNDRLLQKTRRELRSIYGRGQRGRPFGVGSVFSKEVPQFEFCESGDSASNPRSRGLDCSSGMGTSVAVTAAMGFCSASYLIEKLTQ